MQGMEFELAMQVDTTWSDDRVLYIPLSTDSELESCQQRCFNIEAASGDEASRVEEIMRW